MEYAYQKLMKEHNLKTSDLSEDAQIGIQSILSIDRMIILAEKKGTKVRQDVIKKLKANDKWVCREILDELENTDKNSDEIPHSADEIKEEIQQQEVDPIGVEIDGELELLIKEGLKEVDTDTLKAKAPRTYSVIFNNYGEDDDNGVETSHFTLIETDLEVFTLKRK